VSKLEYVDLEEMKGLVQDAERENRLYLEKVREIDEHVITRLFLSACNVETDSNDVEAFPPFRKFVLHRKRV
jgi:hypothetical protein